MKLTSHPVAELKTPIPIQIGLPELPAPGSLPHVRILNRWLSHCEANHPSCKSDSQQYLPTRLIDVGTLEQPRLNLHETAAGETGQYLALSHAWGDKKLHPHFCTYVSNLTEYKSHIDMDNLPSTFRDAVHVTRELGFRYLWIDSICIVQGAGGDFNVESKQMENVFSSASCVIAASSATHQGDGFLKPRVQRAYVTFQRNNELPFYVCDVIDDFNHDVLEGPLCKRAWVLQERALARRTIFFTNRQTYWQCGGGVRCETLTKMTK
jgi:hypothetical protein